MKRLHPTAIHPTATLLVALALAACNDGPACPLPSAPALGSGTTMLDGEPAVVGFADLHTHPGIDRSFDERLVWGDLCQYTPTLSGDSLPAIQPCPVETHRSYTSDPVERSAHGLILPLLNAQDHFVHAPVGTDGSPRLDAWPNGRDVIHQGMHVSSLRRAYEGGLRLLFASVTDSQVLSQLLQGPLIPELFRARAAYEEASALAQLDRIRGVVESQAAWMAIARSPAEARAIIASGRLAVVLSLEMDALPAEAILRLVRDHDVRHVLPVHLVDNVYGGTAVTGDVFNASSAYLSELWGPRYAYIEVERSPTVISTLARPLFGASGPGDVPVYAELDPLPFSWYNALAYTDTCQCTAPLATQSTHVELGHLNTRELTPEGEALIRELLSGVEVVEDGVTRTRPVMVDLSHMDHRTVAATVGVACSLGKPLMASHGGVELPGQVLGQERALSALGAAYVARSGGVFGLGTGGNVDPQLVLLGSGGPALTLASARRGEPRRTACVARGVAPAACSASVPAQPTSPLADADRVRMLHVRTHGGASLCDGSAGLVAYAEVARSPDGAPCGSVPPVITRAPFRADGDGCVADAAPVSSPRSSLACAPDTLAPDMAWGEVCSVAVRWTSTAACMLEGSALAEPTSVDLVADTVSMGAVTVVTLAGAPWARLSSARSGAFVYQKQPVTNRDRRAVRVGVTLGTTALDGAAVTSAGFDVCVRLHDCSGAPIAASPTSRDCDAGWTSVNLRGSWTAGGRVDAYLHLPAPLVPEDVCAIELALLGQGPQRTLEIDEVRVEAVDDPLRLWARELQAVVAAYLPGERGRIAFGTDINGLATQFAFTYASPATFTNGAFGWSARPLSSMRVGSEPLRLEDRGLATYGMLADVVATLAQTIDLPPTDRAELNDSLMLSAEQTLRTWERVEGTRPAGGATCTP